MSDQHIGVDHASEPEIKVEERFMKPTAEYPMGSYLRMVGGNVDIATGFYEKQFPGHPSLYWHGGPPFVVFDCGSREMGTLYWSKDADIDKLPEMHPAPIDPEVDRIDFYTKGPDGEYIPWKPSEGQLQILTALGLPTLVPDTTAADSPAQPE